MNANDITDRLLKAGINCLAGLVPDQGWSAPTIDDGFTLVDVHLGRGFLVLEIGTLGSPAVALSASMAPDDARVLAVKLAKAADRVAALWPARTDAGGGA